MGWGKPLAARILIIAFGPNMESHPGFDTVGSCEQFFPFETTDANSDERGLGNAGLGDRTGAGG